MFTILTKPGCPSCVNAKALLKRINADFTEINHDTEEKIEEFKAAGHRTFPRIYEDGTLVGGFEDLKDYLTT